MREAYRLLIDVVCEESGAYPQLRGTGWVQGVLASEFCKQCLEEDSDSGDEGKT